MSKTGHLLDIDFDNG